VPTWAHLIYHHIQPIDLYCFIGNAVLYLIRTMCVLRLGTYYLYGSSKRLNNRLELEVIEEEEEMGNGKTGDAKDDRSKVG
jgi:hypothetical protein